MKFISVPSLMVNILQELKWEPCSGETGVS